MVRDAIVKEDGTLILNLPKSLRGKRVKVIIRDVPQKSRQFKVEPEGAKTPEQPKTKELTDFQMLLLQGPVMSDEQFKQFQEARKHFRLWNGK